ncbi:hypothetical protein D9V32_14095 [Mycetocola tolaasinivorans]|uniref:Lipoprotein n=1 Tax=Mycetocola tolaasinivorans TaxID=76635 RepID=A0A3L7A0X3_9MICO|nr:hypothetical protein [Mycetocola tolaasinivorans]RLP73658.1 hypothetical protein D9V32_14095 [Mycetocola tolaasinivorans]
MKRYTFAATRVAAVAVALAAAFILLFALAGCSSFDSQDDRGKQLAVSETQFNGRTAPKVTGDAEYQNYIRAQEDVYDDPASIIWCTVYPASDSAPIFTVPIAGKLTSSSVSFFPGSRIEKFGSNYAPAAVENQSVDGMYHGSPPPYRYGFTPGGQYVDFTDLPTFCTTALTEFQRQTLSVAQVAPAGAATARAEELLKAGDQAGAQRVLDELAGK